VARRVRADGGRLLRDPGFETHHVPLFRHETGWHAYEKLLRESLRPDTAMRDRVAALWGFGAFHPREVAALLFENPDRLVTLARLYDAPSILVRRGRVPNEIQEAVASGQAVRRATVAAADAHLVRVKNTLPRVFLAASARIVPSTLTRSRALLFDPLPARPLVDTNDALHEGRLERVPLADLPLPAGPPGELSVLRDAPEELLVSTRTPAARLLVVSDTFFPGWRARVDGEEVDIRRVNFVARGVLVPPGEHRVHFRYEPRGLALGAALTGATAGLLLVWGAWELWRRRRR
jgi:hypothetical protein